MKYLLLPAALLMLVIVSCKKNNGGTVVDENIRINMVETLDTASGNATFGLDCATKTIFSCSNYIITDTVSVSGNHFFITFTGIYKPDFCLTSLGSATTGVNLGKLSNGVYPFTITNGHKVSNLSLTVSDSAYSVSYATLNNINFPHEKILKVPTNTIWGTIEYWNTSQNAEVATFLDSVVNFGAQPFIGNAGYYYFFNVDATHRMSDPDPGHYEYLNFIYNYTGDINNLKTLVHNYGLRNDSLTIFLNTYKGQSFISYIH